MKTGYNLSYNNSMGIGFFTVKKKNKSAYYFSILANEIHSKNEKGSFNFNTESCAFLNKSKFILPV